MLGSVVNKVRMMGLENV